MYRLMQYPPIVTLFSIIAMFLINALTSSLIPLLSVEPVILKSIAIGLFIVSSMLLGSSGWAFKKAHTTVNPLTPEKTSTLVKSGIYAYSRNPMYLGFIGFLMITACLLSNVFTLLLLPLYIITINKRFIEPEEKALSHIFGQQFIDYKNQVRRWI